MDKFIYFNGIKFTRDDKTGYYLNSTIRKRLHRYVWEYHYGEIPKGYHIHHKDHDKSNNDISNLECISPSNHATHHGNDRSLNHYEEMVKNLSENARPKASEWHRSEEGREWHSAHAKEVYENRIKMSFKCEQCGDEFESFKTKSNRFCSNKCKAAWRRESGIDDVDRRCVQCGKEFRINKYSKTKCCSKSCSNRYKPRLPQLRKNKEDN